jgi:nicotinamide riboside transporter PnuC
MKEIIGLVATGLAVGGVVLNNRKMISCFALWIISNAISAGLHANVGLWSLFLRDGIFIILAIEGWHRWSRTK